jgi:hypothetical protein
MANSMANHKGRLARWAGREVERGGREVERVGREDEPPGLGLGVTRPLSWAQAIAPVAAPLAGFAAELARRAAPL